MSTHRKTLEKGRQKAVQRSVEDSKRLQLQRQRAVEQSFLQPEDEKEKESKHDNKDDVVEPDDSAPEAIGLSQHVKKIPWDDTLAWMCFIEHVLKWTHARLRRPSIIRESEVEAAQQLRTVLMSVYMLKRGEFVKVVHHKNERNGAGSWFVALAQLLMIMYFPSVAYEHGERWTEVNISAIDLPVVRERDLALLRQQPILEYTLQECMWLLPILVEDATLREPHADVQRLIRAVEVRMAGLVSFMMEDDVLDAPQYAHPLGTPLYPSSTKSVAIHDARFFQDAERLFFFLHFPEFTRLQLNAQPLPDDNEIDLEPLKRGFLKWTANVLERTSSDDLRRSFRDGLFERALTLHQRELCESKSKQLQQLDAYTILQGESGEETVALLAANAAGSLTLLLNKPDEITEELPAHDELLLQMFNYGCHQRYQFDFIKSFYIRQTQFHLYVPKLLCMPPSQRTQTWREQTAFPFIFDLRPRPIVWLGKLSPPQAWLCPDMLTALALWCHCLERYCGSKIKPPLNRCMQTWFDEMAPKEALLVDSKQLLDFTPICNLPPDLMKRARERLASLFANRQEVERKANEDARKRAEQLRLENEQERKKRQENEAKEAAVHEKRVQELQQQAEAERQRLIKESLERKHLQELGQYQPASSSFVPFVPNAPWLNGMDDNSDGDGKYANSDASGDGDAQMFDAEQQQQQHQLSQRQQYVASTLD